MPVSAGHPLPPLPGAEWDGFRRWHELLAHGRLSRVRGRPNHPMIHRTFCDWHLGDNLVHLNFIRRLALANPDHEFVHSALPEYLWQLRPLVRDLKNASVTDERVSGPCHNAWKNADDFYVKHPNGGDFSAFHVEHFQRLAHRMGLESPIKVTTDLLFDYPELQEVVWPGCEFDYLVVNSCPLSGQLCAYREDLFDGLMRRLVALGRTVAATQGMGIDGVCYTKPMSVTGVGNLSLRCRNIVGVATGPMWTTYNVWAKPELRLVLLDSQERFNLTPDTIQCHTEQQLLDRLLS